MNIFNTGGLRKAYNESKRESLSLKDEIDRLEYKLNTKEVEYAQKDENLEKQTEGYTTHLLRKTEEISILNEEIISLKSDITILNAYLKNYRVKIVSIHDKYVKEFSETNWIPKSKYDEMNEQLGKAVLELKWAKTKLDNMEKIPDMARSAKEIIDMRDSLHKEFLFREKQCTPVGDRFASEIGAKINALDWMMGLTDINGKRVGEQ